MKKIKSFFETLKQVSKVLYYACCILIFLFLLQMSFVLISLASTIGNVAGLLLLVGTVAFVAVRLLKKIYF